jgi:hypothetical protein
MIADCAKILTRLHRPLTLALCEPSSRATER